MPNFLQDPLRFLSRQTCGGDAGDGRAGQGTAQPLVTSEVEEKIVSNTESPERLAR